MRSTRRFPLLQAAAALRAAGFAVQLVDANGFNLPLEAIGRRLSAWQPHMVVTRLAFDCQEEDLKVLALARAACPKALTVARNKIISEVPVLLKALSERPEVDVVACGELDAVLPPLAEAFCREQPEDFSSLLRTLPGLAFFSEKEGFVKTPPAALADVNRQPFAAYDLLPSVQPYRTGMFPDHFAMIQTSRGCPFGCTFCAYAEEKYRPADPLRVVEELRWLKNTFGVRHVLFFDDLLALNAKRNQELAQALLEADLRIEWVCCTRANLVDEPSLRLMHAAGCRELAVGIESGSETILRFIRKGITKDQVAECARLCKKTGIAFYAMTILGLPGETRQTWEETLSFIQELDPFYTQFCFSTPFPNTEMYPWYRERGFLLHENWSEYSPLASYPVVRTEELSADDLAAMRRETYRRLIYRPSFLLRRIRLSDPLWTLKSALEVGKRSLALLSGGYVR